MRTQSQGEVVDYSGGPWAYLLWLGFLLIPLQRAKPDEWWATAGALAMFLALYFWGFHKSGPPLWAARLATFGLGISLFPYNAFAHTLFIYAAIPGAQAKTRESVVIIALTLTGSYAYFTWQHVDSIYFGLVLVIVLGLGASVLVARANRASQQALAGKDVEIARLAKVAERERIARDIHDLLGHTLSLIAIKAELAYKLAATDQVRSAVEMREVAEVARTSLAEVRRAIVGMRSIGLLEALKATDSLLRAAGLETTVNPTTSLPSLTAAQESALAQSLLEAGTNVVRHAQATRVSLSIDREASKVSICVQDNGRGGHVIPGNGLNGMRERMHAVNGSVSITALQPGLSVLAELPL
jgi:two-component system, NarL family, sensor histidine kinase DesK